MSELVVNYDNGIPLALQVLGRFLRSRRRENWEIELDRLKTIPNKIVQNALKISYDSLDEQEQRVFLDIVCFVKVEDMACRHYVERLLGGDTSLKRDIDSLIDKSLIFEYHNSLTIHDLVREMGKEIVRQECIKEPGKRSRLWAKEDCFHIFITNTGTKTIEGISVGDRIEDVEFSATTFKEMHSLRFLQIVEGSVKPTQQLEYLPRALYYLEWYEWPFQAMPRKFSPHNLVELRLCNSNLEELWSGEQDLGNPKYVSLCGSDRLRDVSSLSQAPNLESVDLSECRRLHQVPLLRFGGLNNSYHKCDDSKCSTLRHLNLQKCNAGVILSLECSGYLKTLDLSRSSVEELPLTSIEHLCCLEELDLSFCNLTNFPTSVSNLKFLKRLSLSQCYVSEIPNKIKFLSCVEELDLSANPIGRLPPGIKQLCKLKKLLIQYCARLKFLPELPPSLELVDARGCVSLRSVSSARDYHGTRCKRFLFPSSPFDQETQLRIFKEFVLRVLRLAAAIVLNDVSVNEEELSSPDICIWLSQKKIPKWFFFQTEGTEMCLELDPQWYNANFLGFVVAVVTQEAYVLRYMDFLCYLRFKTRNEELRTFKWYLGRSYYNYSGCNMFVWYKYENYHCCRDAVEMSFRICHQVFDNLKGTTYGIRPLYLQDYEDEFAESVEFYNNEIVFLP